MTPPAEKPGIEEIVVQKPQLIPWIAVLGVIVSGLVGLLGGIAALSFAGQNHPYHYIGAGACLVAPAVGFGLLTNAIYRK